MTQICTGSRPKVLVAQLGARRHYLVPQALAESGHLERFYTDLYYGRRSHLDPLIVSMLGNGGRLRGRSNSHVPISLVFDFPVLALLNRVRRGSPSSRWLASGRSFARAVARAGFGNADVAFAFSSAALELFEQAKDRGITTVLDHATAPRDREMALVAAEMERFPGWSARPPTDDPELEAYAHRQAAERRLADRIVCGSMFVAGELISVGEDRSKLRVVPLAVSSASHLAAARPARSSSLRVLFVGNEGLRKGLGYLVEAVSRLQTRRVHLRVAGDTGFSAFGRSQVSQVCEEFRHVPRDEMASWYAWADVLVLPSVSDTFGLVLLEAMSAGLPVIATPASGGPDVLRDGIDGWIVPLRNSDAIADRLDRLARTPGLAREMGAHARDRAREFIPATYRTRLLEAIAA